jgi:hypothetical protein
MSHFGMQAQKAAELEVTEKMAFKEWTQSLLSLSHVINSKFKYMYIYNLNYFSPAVWCL